MKIESIEFVGSYYKNEQIPQNGKTEVAFFGRSNVGKSSLINCIASSKVARTSSTPGKTRSLNYYLVNQKFYFVDIPGYGFAKTAQRLRDAWKRMVDSWLALEKKRCIFQIIDARLAPQDSDIQLARWLRSQNLPFTVIANKTDQLNQSSRLRNLELIENTFRKFSHFLIPFSTKTELGKNEILAILAEYTQ